ncbi:MAG: fimbrillin family protein [Mediterranea sp.]|nr:fimbrillin family protein [Mediterranea sp.]
MNKKIGLMLCTLFVLSSCTDDREAAETRATAGAIGFNAMDVTPLLSRSDSTRAAEVKIDALKTSGFRVSAYYTETTDWSAAAATAKPEFMYNQLVTWDGTATAWTYSPIKYWPGMVDGTNYGKISFFAWNEGTGATAAASTTAGTPTLTCTIADSQANQKDFVADVVTDETVAGGNVKFRMRHELSRIGFSARLKEAYAATVKVTSLKVIYAANAVESKATYTFGGSDHAAGAWTFPASGKTYMTNAGDEMVATAVTLGTTAAAVNNAGYLMLLPQTIAADAVSMEVTWMVDAVSQKKTISLPAQNWLAGKHYEYNLELSLTKITLDPVVIDPWDDDAKFNPCTMTYRPNDDGTIEPMVQQWVTNMSCPILPSTFNWPMHIFKEWNTKADARGTVYNAGDHYPAWTGNVDLYAQWIPQYHIIYKDMGTGGGFGGVHEAGYPTVHTYGVETTLKTATWATPTEYAEFGGWYATSDATGTPVTELGGTDYTADITLYAKWMKVINLANATLLPEGVTFASNLFTITKDGKYKVINKTTAYRIEVAANVTCEVTPSNAEIEMGGAYSAFSLGAGAKVTMKLSGWNEFEMSITNTSGLAGVHVPQTAELVIESAAGDGTGTDGILSARGYLGAGIGGVGENSTSGTVIIKGGTVYASQGNGASCGIGGAYNGKNGKVVIEGGDVSGTGSQKGGAGIGGYGSDGAGEILITGGTVFGNTHGAGAGIGGANGSGGGTITITGGKVRGNSNGEGCGIGAGKGGQNGIITISGGEVEATIYGTGAAMGGFGSGGAGTINISGGIVKANGIYDATQGAGIGTGLYEGTGTVGGGTINISGGEVYAKGSKGGAGIGGGKKGTGCTVNISGGYVEAAPGDADSGYGACIGGGPTGTERYMTVTGGFVFMNVNDDTRPAFGAGSGGSESGSITVNGGTVVSAGGFIGKVDEVNMGTTVKFANTAMVFAKKVGGMSGSDFSSRITAFTISGKTITLTGDLTVPSGAVLTIPADWTLKLSGKTITNNGTVECGTNSAGIGGTVSLISGYGTVTN